VTPEAGEAPAGESEREAAAPEASQGPEARRGRRREPRIVNRRPVSKKQPGHKPRKRAAFRPLRETVQQRTQAATGRRKARKRLAWRPLREIMQQQRAPPVRAPCPARGAAVSSDPPDHRRARPYRGRPLQCYAVLESDHAQVQAERERQDAQQRRALRRLATAWEELMREAQRRDQDSARAVRQQSHDSEEAARLLWLEIQAEEASPVRDPQRRAALFRRLASIRRRQHG